MTSHPSAVISGLPDQVLSEDRDSPSNRLLRAIEIIAVNGPLTHTDLKSRMGISKTATWRLVKTLRDAGWVDLRNGGTYVELSAHVEQVFAKAAFADPEFRPIMDAMTAASEAHDVSIELLSVRPDGQIEHRNSTRRIKLESAPVPGAEPFVLLALRAAMSPAQLERNVIRLLPEGAPQADVRAALCLAADQLRGFEGQSWSHDLSALAVSLQGERGTPAALVISAKSNETAAKAIQGSYHAVARDVVGHVQWFGAKPADAPSA